MTDAARTRGCYLQLSLRVLLLLITAFAAWLGLRVREARFQREFVAALVCHRSDVQYDWDPNQSFWRPPGRAATLAAPRHMA